MNQITQSEPEFRATGDDPTALHAAAPRTRVSFFMGGNMEQLYEAWLTAKADEQTANAIRIDVEKRILAAMKGIPEEGSKTVTDGVYKIVIGNKINRTIDRERWHSVVDRVPDGMSPVTVVEQFKIDDAGCRWLKENRPDVWAIVAQAITEKPAKPSIKIEVRDV